jgi:hypothetical protein
LFSLPTSLNTNTIATLVLMRLCSLPHRLRSPPELPPAPPPCCRAPVCAPHPLLRRAYQWVGPSAQRSGTPVVRPALRVPGGSFACPAGSPRFLQPSRLRRHRAPRCYRARRYEFLRVSRSHRPNQPPPRQTQTDGRRAQGWERPGPVGRQAGRRTY